MSWFSVFKSQPHHEGRTYNDANKLGRELTPKEVKENGEIFLLDAIKSMPHAEKRGNTVLLDPKWLDGMQPSQGLYGIDWNFGDRVFGFSFDFRDVHEESLCIEFYYQRKSKRREYRDAEKRIERIGEYFKHRMCIQHRRVPDNVEGDDDFSQVDYKRTATPADDYAAIIYMTSDKDFFNSLWNTQPIRQRPDNNDNRMTDIIDDYIYRRLSDGRLQERGFNNLTDDEQRRLIEDLKNAVNYDLPETELVSVARRRMGDYNVGNIL